MNPILQKAVEVYGGEELWKKSTKIEAEVSVSGLLFALKQRPHFEHCTVNLEIARPFSKISSIGKNDNLAGVLDGHNVWLEDNSGEIIQKRNNARDFFKGFRRWFYWDDLDMTYFANYAFWNYLTFPRLILNTDVIWNEVDLGKFVVEFPDYIPSHSKKQEFIFDSTNGRLLQQNYIAEVVSKLANAANVTSDHKIENGILYPSRRIVTPKSKNGAALKMPLLVDITIHKFSIT